MYKCEFCGEEFSTQKELNHHLKKYHKNDIFIQKARKIHVDKYDYSKVEYINSKTKVCIICPKHGPFWQTPNNHINKSGCPYCYGNVKLNTNQFIEKSKNIHSDKYDYSKVEYINNSTKVCIICPEHGEFKQIPFVHLQGFGCPKCTNNHHYNTKEWIEEARKIHGNMYDYSNVEYKNAHTKVCIICSIHGEFWQKPIHHLHEHGCPKCNHSKLELEILNNFSNLSYQKRFDWLKNKFQMSLDFYNEEKHVAIECQGEQHFHISETSMFGKKKNGLYNTQLRDQLKYQQCKEHGIEIIYYFPEEFLKYNIEFYKDKKCFHNIESIKEYLEKHV